MWIVIFGICALLFGAGAYGMRWAFKYAQAEEDSQVEDWTRKSNLSPEPEVKESVKSKSEYVWKYHVGPNGNALLITFSDGSQYVNQFVQSSFWMKFPECEKTFFQGLEAEKLEKIRNKIIWKVPEVLELQQK